jgi:large subunit ribosomal protein L18
MSREGEIRAARKSRHSRVRKHVGGVPERPRLCVFRSLKHIYAQVIDDTCGHTLVSASSLDPELRSGLEGKSKVDKAEQVGTLVAKRAKGKGITDVVFDRGGCKYHGRVKSLADGARTEGLRF